MAETITCEGCPQPHHTCALERIRCLEQRLASYEREAAELRQQVLVLESRNENLLALVKHFHCPFDQCWDRDHGEVAKERSEPCPAE